MNGVLWAVQAALALVFFLGATVRASRYEFAKRQMAWVGAVPRPLLLFISIAEITGALGLVLPGATHRAVMLTSAAAASLALVQGLAFLFHRSRHETVVPNAVLIALAVFVAVGRPLGSPF